jgi:hypothetical protein
MSRAQADEVALAVDAPTDKRGFPWPYADRKPSFVPKNITPAPLPPIDPLLDVAEPFRIDGGPEPDRMWPYVLAAVVSSCGLAFVICAYVWR